MWEATCLRRNGPPSTNTKGEKKKKKKKNRLYRRVEWQRLIFPWGWPQSIVGAERLNCRVRDGNGCFPFAIVTTPPACTLQYPKSCSILNRIEHFSKENTLVEMRGLEPLTSAVQRQRSSS